MNQFTKPLYAMSQSVFYTILKWAVNLFSNYADDFAAFSDTYGPEWASAMQKQIAEAQAMPNVGQRRGNTKSAGNDLVASSHTAVLVWEEAKALHH